QRFEHEEGAAEARIAAAEARDVLAWRTGRLIYREQPLREVVDDLNQRSPREPISRRFLTGIDTIHAR
ncbi:MAG: hypothetical protein SFV23_21975, partial [Planctomycetaceae bacterium]|nr:hypothetical protein [Planctomycetaceae bacterium]